MRKAAADAAARYRLDRRVRQIVRDTVQFGKAVIILSNRPGMGISQSVSRALARMNACA